MAEQKEDNRPPDDIVIFTEGLTRRFGRVTAVRDLNLKIHKGEVFGFLGPNGAGKSTLIRMLLGLLSPSSGLVRVLNFNIPKQAEKLRHLTGYMPQKFSLYEDLTVRENLMFAAQIFGLNRETMRRRLKQVVNEFGLEKRLQQRPAEMSGGWKQRLALAAGTIHNPKILFLDEPTAGVDPESRRMFWGKLFEIASHGTTILVSTHYMDEAVRCHRICMIREGRLSAIGHPAELTSALENRIVEMTASPIEAAIKAVTKNPIVESVTQLGNQIHILLKPDAPPSEEATVLLLKQLKSDGFTHLLAKPAEPNLEDVFVCQSHGGELNKGTVCK